VGKREFESIREAGHNLRGTGAAYGFPRITDLGEEIESAAKSSDIDRILAAVSELDGFLQRAKREL
jgi:HPt (histidine-containing phosphotransfer) domain-containing protein